MLHAVVLADGTEGTMDSSLLGHYPEFYMRQEVTIQSRDEQGAYIDETGILVEVLE